MAIAIAVIKDRAKKWLDMNPSTSGFLRKYICEESNMGAVELCLLVSLLSDILPDDSLIQHVEEHPLIEKWRDGSINIAGEVETLRHRFTYIDEAFLALESKTTDSETDAKSQDLKFLLSMLIFISHIHEI